MNMFSADIGVSPKDPKLLKAHSVGVEYSRVPSSYVLEDTQYCFINFRQKLTFFINLYSITAVLNLLTSAAPH
jgi:hypothetical protein